MSKVHIGVIRGGPSNEYDVSLKTGANVLQNLPRDKYAPVDIFIDREGGWYANGFPTNVARLSSTLDVVFNALHGTYGEDGKVQHELEQFAIPYTGSQVFPSAIAMNKAIAKTYLEHAGAPTPRGYRIKDERGEMQNQAVLVFQTLSAPYVIKPISGGSSLGVTITESFESFYEAITMELQKQPSVLVEEYIAGRELTCSVFEGNDGELYTLSPVEIIVPEGKQFFDYDVKYSGQTEEVCPADIPEDVEEEVRKTAMRVHKALGLRHYSRTDFIFSPRGLFVLEVNSLPGLAGPSLLPRSLHADGIELPRFIDHVVSLARSGK